MDYGIKISRPGYDVKTAAPDELVFSSKYKTLRVRSQGSGIITESGGRIVTIAHNLGHVPYFIVHATPDPDWILVGGADSYVIHPYVPVITGACHIERDVYAYADNNNLYIKLGDDFGYLYSSTSLTNGDYAYRYDGSGGGSGIGDLWVGHDPSYGNEDGAIRFPDVYLNQNQSIVSAVLSIYIGARDGSGQVDADVYGVDVDNIGSFGNPFGESPTTAHETTGTTQGVGSLWSINVKSIVEEIIGRGGWSSGNAMAFTLRNNGTTGDNAVFVNTSQDSGFYCSNSSLRILKSNNLCNYKYTIFYNKIE